MIDGENIFARSGTWSARARVGMVFQKSTPFPKSIYDNIAYAIRVYKYDQGGARRSRRKVSASRPVGRGQG